MKITGCGTCGGVGHLDKSLHWNDCPPGCRREHSFTCVSCMGSGRPGNRFVEKKKLMEPVPLSVTILTADVS